ncbi:expressed unknown protein [Seminavis robusta]|uniref:Uncharacterized protein n=1 Tax=Seminavis robusta TaxID=568900 RepID=A0A9N8DII6_9STRA|nr:expressed unknown protein [Seminavis robusta]|eukprot:Sro139_g065200.1 n/a (171) ;mRNA; f:91310-91822
MNFSRNSKKQPSAQNAEPEITVAPATLASERFGSGTVVEAEAYQIPAAVTYDPSKGTTAEIPSFEDALDENLPTANARPTPKRQRPSPKRQRATPQTGEELLRRMKMQRKAATVNSGLWGGLLGLILLGPVGAVGVGAGSAIMTKHSMKRREKVLRKRLEGRLHEPMFLI